MVVGDLFFQAPRPPWLAPLLSFLQPSVAKLAPIHFFRDPDLLPPDTDCTSVGFSLAIKARMLSPASLRVVAQQVASNTDPDGIVQVYFDRGGRRDGLVDAVVCANALYFLNQMGLADAAARTETFVFQYLESRSFQNGSRYYPSADTFLYFLSRLVTTFPFRYSTWFPTLTCRARERQGLESRPLELAQRMLASTRLGVDAAMDAWLLRSSCNPNGSFPADALFQYGRSSRYFGGEAITTAFAARALTEYGRWLRLSKPCLARWRSASLATSHATTSDISTSRAFATTSGISPALMFRADDAGVQIGSRV